jgi:pimeloyl-ACP methyl ester carboxylesterase
VRILAKIFAGVVLAVMVYVALDGAMTALQPPLKMRGEMVDIGGRRLHLICEGSADASPTVVFEAGAFGLSADGAAIQDRLAAKGFRACNYDRAGLGLSDPGPRPRDGLAVVTDLEKLLGVARLPGPYILVGHSMAGLYIQLFANRNPAKTMALVYVDAATPEITDTPDGRRFVGAYIRASRLAAFGAEAGLYQPLSYTWFGDKIGLSPVAKAEKRRAFASPKHNRWASAEVDQWFVAADQAKASGALDPDLPVAVVLPARRLAGEGGLLRLRPATQSRHGYVETVARAGHANLLGLRHADAVVRAVEAVAAAARTRAS